MPDVDMTRADVRPFGEAVAIALVALGGLGTPQAKAATVAPECATVTLRGDGTLACDMVTLDAGLAARGMGRMEPPGITFAPALDVVGDPVRARIAPMAAAPGAMAGATIGQLVSPLGTYALTSGFGERFHPILGGYRMHQGIDMAAPMGTSVHSAGAGVVTLANWDRGYGLSVRIRHGGGVETHYAHLSRISVQQGQVVTAGEPIGQVGATGLATGAHLHYEVKVNGSFTNPLQLPQFQRLQASLRRRR